MRTSRLGCTYKIKNPCEVNGCKSPGKYALYKTFPDGKKVWLHVCREHEAEIGQENLRRASGYVYQSASGELMDDRGLIKVLEGTNV